MKLISSREALERIIELRARNNNALSTLKEINAVLAKSNPMLLVVSAPDRSFYICEREIKEYDDGQKVRRVFAHYQTLAEIDAHLSIVWEDFGRAPPGHTEGLMALVNDAA